MWASRQRWRGSTRPASAPRISLPHRQESGCAAGSVLNLHDPPPPALLQHTRIRVDWKLGVAAADWESIAKKENLNAMATELRRLEETVREIHEEMIAMRRREEEMREISESTSRRVSTFAILSLLLSIGVGVWQLIYLRSFFIRKKVL